MVAHRRPRALPVARQQAFDPGGKRRLRWAGGQGVGQVLDFRYILAAVGIPARGREVSGPGLVVPLEVIHTPRVRSARGLRMRLREDLARVAPLVPEIAIEPMVAGLEEPGQFGLVQRRRLPAFERGRAPFGDRWPCGLGFRLGAWFGAIGVRMRAAIMSRPGLSVVIHGVELVGHAMVRCHAAVVLLARGVLRPGREEHSAGGLIMRGRARLSAEEARIAPALFHFGEIPGGFERVFAAGKFLIWPSAVSLRPPPDARAEISGWISTPIAVSAGDSS